MPSYRIDVARKIHDCYYLAMHPGEEVVSRISTHLTKDELITLMQKLGTKELVGVSFESPERTFDDAVERMVHPWVYVDDLTDDVIVPALIQGKNPETRYVYDLNGWLRKIYGREYLIHLNSKLAPHNLSIREADASQFRIKKKKECNFCETIIGKVECTYCELSSEEGPCIYCQLVSEKGTRNLLFTPTVNIFQFEDDLKK